MVLRYQAMWSIPNAGPSVSTFHTDGTLGVSSPGGIYGAIRAWFDANKGALPDDVTINFDSEIQEVDEATGQLTGVVTFTPPAPVQGTVAGTWPAGTGIRQVWTTGRILDGRRVRGATFLVPVGAGLFTTGGQVSTGAISDIQGKSATLLGSLSGNGTPMMVYSRPRAASETLPSRPGTASIVTGQFVSPIVGTLRGRKY